VLALIKAGFSKLAHVRLAFALACMAGISACTGAQTQSAALKSATAGAGTSESGGLRGDLEIVPALPAPAQTNNGADEVIAENDLLEVDVFQVDDLDRTVRVDSKGRISLALIGAVDARGKTITALQSEIAARYRANYLQNPEVSVFMKESAGQRVTVDGSVIKPGIYAVSSTTTLLQVIAQAGGFQPIADEKKLYVFRQIGARKLVANYSVADIRAGKKSDPRIFGGDVIVSFDSSAKVAAKNLREALGIASSAAMLGPL
jgi:polysaccharide export outer membrane protein